MTESNVGNPVLNQNSELSFKSWFKKTSSAVASKTSRFFGRNATSEKTAASAETVAGFIPSQALAVDTATAARNLDSRRITNSNTKVDTRNRGCPPLNHPATNLPVIPEAKVQWQRYINDEYVIDTMKNCDRFLANNVLQAPEDIPAAAYMQLYKAINGDIPIELITQNGVETVQSTAEAGRWIH